METGLIDSIGKLSIEVVAILTLSYLVHIQGKGHDKMSKSLDRLTVELGKRNDDGIAVKKIITQIHKEVKDHHIWSKVAINKIAKN